jgi:quercetin dioxygenase-like cupin family protein
MKLHWLALTSIGIALSAPAFAKGPAPAKSTPPSSSAPVPIPSATHNALNAADLKWVDAPPGLPRGAKVSVLHGDPTVSGLFTMRIKMPAGYKVPPHFHPADENVTVLSGDLHMAMGDKWDETKGHTMTAGGFSNMPKGFHHYAWTTRGAIFQVHAMGPWGITYLDPADDPRNAAKTASK